MIGFTVLFKNPVEQLFKPQVVWGTMIPMNLQLPRKVKSLNKQLVGG